MSSPDIGEQPVEHDPTGVRALLAGLPDPGPMPAGLVARIEAALAAETDPGARFARVMPGAAADPTRDDGILRGQARAERRRVVLPWLAAAAAAGILTVSGTNLLHDHSSAIVAAFGGGSSAGSAASSSSAPSPRSSTQAHQGDASAVTVVRSGAAYTVAGLADEAAALTSSRSGTSPSPTAEGPAGGGLGTSAGARNCALTHGVDLADPLTVSVGTIDGTPGILVVAWHGGGRTAYAFSMSCTVLAGPVRLP